MKKIQTYLVQQWQGEGNYFPSYSSWFRGLSFVTLPIILLDLLCTFLPFGRVLDFVTALLLVLLVATFVIETVIHGFRHFSKSRSYRS